jgi:hypothetical protein
VSSNLLTSCRMVSRLSGVYLLSFCLIGLYDGSMPNLCSITPLGILDISKICHVKTSKFSQRKMMSVSSYLNSRHVLIRSFLSGLLGSTRTFFCHQPLSSSNPLTDRQAAGLTLRRHMRPSWVTNRGESIIDVLGIDDLINVLPLCVFAILAACSWAAFLSNYRACVNVSFSHALASC